MYICRQGHFAFRDQLPNFSPIYMSCNSNDTVLHLHSDHFTWIFQQLQPSHLGLCQQCRIGNWLCPSSAPLLLDSNSATIFSCLIPFSIHYLICNAAFPPYFFAPDATTFCSLLPLFTVSQNHHAPQRLWPVSPPHYHIWPYRLLFYHFK